MNELDDIQYSPILDYRYERFFRDTHYNGNRLDEATRKKLISIIDEDVAQYSESLPMLAKMLDQFKDYDDDGHQIYCVIVSVMQFAIITMIDCMVIGKYFMLADCDYDKRFMRGKMKAVLNEGFKKLYGFEEKTRMRSEWNKVGTIINYFSEELVLQYKQLSSLLDHHSQTSSWWRDERNMETHLDTEKLYVSRCEEVVEAQVMLDSLKLFDALFAVNLFLSNLHACLRNVLLDKFLRGELKEEE